MRIRHLLPALLASTLFLAGCTGSSDSSDASDDKGGDASALTARLASAKEALDSAETIDISLATKSLPDGITGLLSAQGKGNHSPAFKGKVTVITGGSSLGADVIAVDGKVYAKTGFAPNFVTIDPKDLKAPDPASLLSTDAGISQILVKTESISDGGQSRDGKDVLTTVKGTLPGTVVATIIPSAASDQTFKVTYRLDDDDQLRDATLTGQFYPEGGDVTYTVGLATSDTPVTITAP
ncbi:LppX_LprAFG lipoprotein [Aeromicrobium sp. UC242_57]|uniref:LppX_LprAFG lipoprotein n=1 Tax=Aeromicrobium sp. UC242_57 TaxID=3374624 RepID=UPI0037A3E00B